jgi:hypothetical protein
LPLLLLLLLLHPLPNLMSRKVGCCNHLARLLPMTALAVRVAETTVLPPTMVAV